MNAQDYYDLLKLSFTVRHDCFHIHQARPDGNLVKIVKLNDDSNHYVLTKMASDLFMAIIASESSTALAVVIEQISKNYEAQHHQYILDNSLKVVGDLLKHEILEIVDIK